MKQDKKNLWFYPLGTVGRDMMYALFTNFLMQFILLTRDLSSAQFVAVTAIMVGARIFDALNDPIMGNIIEKTRSKYGKFKPWLLIGVLSTSVVVYFAFNSTFQGWDFVIFFGVIYFLYSITYTMHDISYWGMVPALSEDGDMRNRITSRATLFAGVGGLIASVCIPMFTVGEKAIGGSTVTGFGRVALVICILTPLFILFTLFGVKENRADMNTEAPKISFKKIVSTIGKNDQLLWISLIFLIQEIGNGVAIGGVGANYIYFEFGYSGGLYSTFSTIGMVATGILMIVYPSLSRKLNRQKLVSYLAVVATAGYILMLAVGVVMPSSSAKFWIITIGYMFTNLGQYGLYLVMMISIINTVEYNELKLGTRDEAIITSMRPFLTKLASSLVVVITSATYIISKVKDYTDQISSIEREATIGGWEDAVKMTKIEDVISTVGKAQSMGLLIAMTVIPCILMLISVILYRKFYKLNEDEFDRICKELDAKRK